MLETDKARTCRKLNLGSGVVLLDDYVNFDAVSIERRGKKTDVLGRIEDIVGIFGENRFDEILCTHVIEHLWPNDGLKMLQDCFSILAPNGVLVLEAPSVQGIIELYNEGHPMYKEGISAVIDMLYGTGKHAWKELGYHKWGYTVDTAAKAMESVGFKITHKGIGTTHGMGKRDFRVVGVKA